MIVPPVEAPHPLPIALASLLEGPAAAEDGSIYFSDLINNRILRLDSATGRVTTFRQPSGRANGLLFDHRGRLLACEGNEYSPDDDGHRRVTRTDLATGEVQVVCDQWQGRRLNSPNDIACAPSGHLFFTDPCYGDRSRMELDHESVYRIDPDGRVTLAISQPDIQTPNGIHVSPDGRTLYVVDSCPLSGGNRCLWAFDLDASLQPRRRRRLIDFAPGRGGDGMAVDVDGRLYVAAGIRQPRGTHETADVPAGVYVFAPSGELLRRIPILEDLATNVTFGGRDLKTLYMTAGKSLLTTRVERRGWAVHRRSEPTVNA
ncbi:MAG: SMP-30/gluconolactonase/LRE family protein [Planctomyces sp.]|nr:SMP-30/gluconolactonase/LRE family protein [Planctomyces sp.]